MVTLRLFLGCTTTAPPSSPGSQHMSSRRPSGPATPRRPGSRRPVAGRPVRRLRAALVGVLASAVLVVTAAPAVAAPPPPPNPTDGQIGTAQSEQDAAAAEVGRIQALVAT